MVNKAVVHGANEQLKTRFVKQTVKISVPEACDEGISALEVEGPGRSKNNFLHDGGWQNI